MDAELSSFRIFAEIVAAGSLSEAARRMQMSLTFVSRRLSSLEDKLGARLIDRSAHTFTLTNEGLFFHERVAAILDTTDAAVSEVRALRGRIEGNLRVSAPSEIGRRQIALLCRKFSVENPELTIELSLTDTRPDVLRGGLDVAIVTKRPTEGDVIQRKILESRRVICAAPSYISAHGRPTTPEELALHKCILLRRGSRLYDQWMIRTTSGVSQISVPKTLVSNSTDVVHAWVLEGAGIAVKALWDIEDDLRDSRLVELLGEYGTDSVALYVVFSSRRHIPHRLRKFIDFLIEYLPLEDGV